MLSLPVINVAGSTLSNKLVLEPASLLHLQVYIYGKDSYAYTHGRKPTTYAAYRSCC
jgi:hypothetical protein